MCWHMYCTHISPAHTNSTHPVRHLQHTPSTHPVHTNSTHPVHTNSTHGNCTPISEAEIRTKPTSRNRKHVLNSFQYDTTHPSAYTLTRPVHTTHPSAYTLTSLTQQTSSHNTPLSIHLDQTSTLYTMNSRPVHTTLPPH